MDTEYLPPKASAVARGYRRIMLSTAVLLVALVAPPGADGTQREAAEIIDEALERRQARLADVHDYALKRRINGRDTLAYYERREIDDMATFEPLSSLRLALEGGVFDDTPLAALAPGGDVLDGLRDALLDAAVQVGAAAIEQQLGGAAAGQIAGIVDALIRPPAPGAGEGETLGSLVDVEAFGEALVEGALRVGMTQLASQVLGLPGDTGLALLDAVRGKAEPGELLSLIHISEPTRQLASSRMPSSA